VSDLPVPRATRLQRPRWRDARLLVGVVLMLASVVLGSLVVRAADDTVPMYAARSALVPGQRLDEGDLVRVDVRLAGQSARYLSAATGLAPDQYVLREVRPGELVPTAAVGGRDQIALQPLTLTVDGGSAAGLVLGSQVDVYVNTPAADAGVGSRKFSGPELALQRVSVSSLPRESDGLGGGASGERPVQVMAPTEQIKDVIGKVDQGARVTVVPVPGTRLRVDQ
jgi:hypothetical protein